MKANSSDQKWMAMAVAASVMTVLGSCTAQQPAPPIHQPIRQTIPVPLPVPPKPAIAPARWQDAPATPGDWRWSMEGNQSVASFADGALVLRCDPATHTVTLLRSGTASGEVPLTIATSSTLRAFVGTPQAGGIAAALAARDSLLDAMAFSRGRFLVEVAGLPTLYVPSWPEVSRVVEDCR
jgi:hypothetical protein